MNARLFYGGSIQPSPTIAQAIFSGYDILETRCGRRCGLCIGIPLDTIRAHSKTEIWNCEIGSAALRTVQRQQGLEAAAPNCLPPSRHAAP